MATSVDYSGRTVDLLIFQGTQPSGMVQVSLGFGDAGYLTTGIQKVSQTFALSFLMESGSVPDQRAYGTAFVTQFRLGYLRDESSVKAAFSFASDSVVRAMRIQAAQAGMPDDETIKSARLLSYSLDKGTGNLQLRVQITSEAGIARTVFLPIPVTIK